jgi:hypothetical protein
MTHLTEIHISLSLSQNIENIKKYAYDMSNFEKIFF